MAAQNFTEFNLPKNAYAAFDAVSLKKLIIDRLKTSNVFTDQAFEGSNLAAIIDVIAYAYHVSLFYLNNQASEASFNQATLYENMNKLVALIGYNPTGSQTSILPFEARAGAGLATGTYVIPKFSFIVVNGVFFTVTNDIYFDKTVSSEELLESIGEQNVLYQGQIREFPTQTAIGEDFEIKTLTVNSQVAADQPFVDANNIFVFVKDANTSTWVEWTEVSTLYNETPSSKVFEKRLNDTGLFEIKFGNNITGKRLNANDQIAIYYLQSDGTAGVVSSNAIQGGKFVRYTSPRYREMVGDIYDSTTPLINQNELNSVLITSTNRSTDIKFYETVEEIRQNAPKIFSAQNRVVTEADYNSYIIKNFSNIIIDVQTISNKTYIDEYLKYFYNIGLKQPNDDTRVLLNQVAFADSCDFNNVYVYVVPRNFITNQQQPQYLSTALKQLIVNTLQPLKMQNVEIVPSDPVYVAVDVGVVDVGEAPSTNARQNAFIQIKKVTTSKISTNQIVSDVYETIIDYFSPTKLKLGQQLSLFDLTHEILALPGVADIQTVRIVDGKTISSPGLNFVIWNPLYDTEDVIVTLQNIILPIFKYPFLINSSSLINKIIIE